MKQTMNLEAKIFGMVILCLILLVSLVAVAQPAKVPRKIAPVPMSMASVP